MPGYFEECRFDKKSIFLWRWNEALKIYDFSSKRQKKKAIAFHKTLHSILVFVMVITASNTKNQDFKSQFHKSNADLRSVVVTEVLHSL